MGEEYKVALLREQLQTAETQRQLAASEARAAAYREQIDALRQTAADARAASQEGRWTVLGVLGITPVVVVLILVLQAVRNGQENRRKLRRDLEAQLLPAIRLKADELVSEAVAGLEREIEDVRYYLDRVSEDVRRDRLSTLDGLRLFFYRQAYDFKSRGAWGRAIMFTVYALVAEFEAAELTGEESRFRYARVALANHGKLLIEHVEDFARETDLAWWDTRDLDQIRSLKRFASGDLVPTLILLEQHTLQSMERIANDPAPAA